MISNLSPYQKYRFMHILEEQLASLYLFIHNKKVTKQDLEPFVKLYGLGTLVDEALRIDDMTMVEALEPFFEDLDKNTPEIMARIHLKRF